MKKVTKTVNQEELKEYVWNGVRYRSGYGVIRKIHTRAGWADVWYPGHISAAVWALYQGYPRETVEELAEKYGNGRWTQEIEEIKIKNK